VRTGSTVLALTVLLIGWPSSSYAEWQFTPFIGQTFKGATTLVDFEEAFDDTRWNIGGAVRVVGASPIGVESLFVYTGGVFQHPTLATSPTRVITSRTYAWMGNAVLTTPLSLNRYGLRPFVSGGLGLMHVRRRDVLDAIPVRLNLLGMNAGGGAVGFVSDRVGLRFDLRYFRNIRGVPEEDLEVPVTSLGESIRLRYWTLTFGVVIKY
jgi:hypothetical protein